MNGPGEPVLFTAIKQPGKAGTYSVNKVGRVGSTRGHGRNQRVSAYFRTASWFSRSSTSRKVSLTRSP